MQTFVTLMIFIICYFFIIIEKIERSLIAVAGGVLMLLLGIYSIDRAFIHYIDWNTITLLFSMMIIVSITSKTGVFEFLAIGLAKLLNGRPIPLLIMISILTAVGSAFLANVTIVLLLVPVIFTIVRILELPAIPFLIVMIIASNIGGTATLIGDPPNIMIGQAVEHLTFNAFLIHLSPIVLIVFLSTMSLLSYKYRGKLTYNATLVAKLQKIKTTSYLKQTPALPKSLFVLLLTIAGFMLYPFIHVDITTVALAGAVLLLLLTYDEYQIDTILKEVEWGTLFFFIGLFLLVGGLEEVGLLDELARAIVYYTEGDLRTTAFFILWVTGLFSGFVDNIPFVAAMIPVVNEFKAYGMTNLDPLWWSLAMGACFGGNGTLLGSTANLVVAGMAAKEKEPISFMEFLKVGLPIVFLSLVISTIYIYFRYLIDF
ncbi:ArsB/NhaD family transporter [Bacillus carboniphilus]|uniref:ArsB/NhaD family transporter n=1 Tax=Bacillus carboniphilus TaxID=86663 RepID=A0ABY9JXF0_9BACI|nr:ArsB/NhaD family transporter [Bacillus carboniphilus]WLR44059.1 ArsB/NhaD family transporter [Bacillus carboniphilus]